MKRLPSRLARGRAAAADWLVAGADLARATRRRLRPGAGVVGDDSGCGGPPVLVLPGILEPWTYMLPVGRHLQERGHPVHYVETLGWNLRGLERSVELCLRALESADGAVIVAHSKGGLIGKAVLARAGTAALGMVSLATPYLGSGLGGRLQRLPLLDRSPLGMFLPDSPELLGLAAERAVNARIVSLAPAWDQVIPGGSYLDGATNVTLDVGGHFRPLRDPRVHAMIHEHVHALSESAA
ncbi:MAG: alpha/beta hydrolase [Propionibacterium sp.]|nr:alpha/beta hydrolase [Propionibacterium sp.]